MAGFQQCTQRQDSSLFEGGRNGLSEHYSTLCLVETAFFVCHLSSRPATAHHCGLIRLCKESQRVIQVTLPGWALQTGRPGTQWRCGAWRGTTTARGAEANGPNPTNLKQWRGCPSGWHPAITWAWGWPGCDPNKRQRVKHRQRPPFCANGAGEWTSSGCMGDCTVAIELTICHGPSNLGGMIFSGLSVT